MVENLEWAGGRTGRGKPAASAYWCSSLWTRSCLRVRQGSASPLWRPTCTDDAAPGEASQTSCPRKAACSFRNLLSPPVPFPGQEHLSVNLPTVQMSVWNHNDIYQRGLEIVTRGLQIMKPMPFIDTCGSFLIWDIGCQKIEVFCGSFPSEAILYLISRLVLAFKSELFSAFRFGVSS